MKPSEEQEEPKVTFLLPLDCTHEEDITYYKTRKEWTYKGEKFRAVDVMCTECALFGVQIEVYDESEDNWCFVTEYWNA